MVHDSDPEGLDVARRWARKDPKVAVVHTSKASRSEARNAATAVAKGDWCLFLDDDVALPEGALRALVDAIRRRPEARVVGGPNRLPPDAGPFERAVDRVLTSRFGAWTMRRRYAAKAGGGWVDERSLSACNLAVARAALSGGETFHDWLDYGEETLLLARLGRQGARMFYEPGFWVYHHRRSGWLDFCRQAFGSGVGRARQSVLLPSSLRPEFLGPPALAAAVVLAPAFPGVLSPCLAAYGSACALFGVAAAVAERSLATGLLSSLLTASGHLSYGLGFWLFALARPWPGGLRRGIDGWTRQLARWALKASRWPALRPLLRAYYRAALGALRLWLRAAGLTHRGLWLRRGMTRPDWAPGSSDIDLALLLPELTLEQEAAWLDRWHRDFPRLRRIFPVLGEVQAASSREWSAYAAFGDVRRGDLGAEAVPLDSSAFPFIAASGRDDPLAAAKRSIDAWTEQLHAQIQLGGLYFRGEEPMRAAAAARKALADIDRYAPGASGERAGPAVTRQEAARAALADPELRFIHSRLASSVEDVIWTAVEDALAEGVLRLEASAREALSRVPPGEPPPFVLAAPAPAPEDAQSFARACEAVARAGGGTLVSGLHDNLFGILLVLDAAERERIEATLSIARGVARQEAVLRGAVLPLGPLSFRLALAGPYLEDPMQASVAGALAEPDGAVAVRSGRLDGVGRHVVGLWRVRPETAAPLPAGLVDAFLRESLAHLAINWRAECGETSREPAYTRWTYLHGRALALRLWAETGKALPCFPLEALVERFSAAFGEEAAEARRVLEGAGPGRWSEHRRFIARQIRSAVEALDGPPRPAKRGEGRGEG